MIGEIFMNFLLRLMMRAILSTSERAAANPDIPGSPLRAELRGEAVSSQTADSAFANSWQGSGVITSGAARYNGKDWPLSILLSICLSDGKIGGSIA